MKIFLFASLSVAFLAPFCSAGFAADEFVEPGRFGVEGTISPNGFQAGLAREADQYEAILDIDAHTGSSGGVTSGDVGIEVRAGKRFNIGSFNYLSIGADGQTSVFSKTDGVSTNGSYIVGPYVGFQRHFSGTSLMLTIYALPVSYSYTPAAGGAPTATEWQFFQQGAFGVSYLF